jgi:hypothetical protein
MCPQGVRSPQGARCPQVARCLRSRGALMSRGALTWREALGLRGALRWRGALEAKKNRPGMKPKAVEVFVSSADRGRSASAPVTLRQRSCFVAEERGAVKRIFLSCDSAHGHHGPRLEHRTEKWIPLFGLIKTGSTCPSDALASAGGCGHRKLLVLSPSPSMKSGPAAARPRPARDAAQTPESTVGSKTRRPPGRSAIMWIRSRSVPTRAI